MPRGGRVDESGIKDSFRFAIESAQKAEANGFEISLIAQRYMGVDLDAWVLASALASNTSKLQLMVAIHPGIITPQVTAKMGATLDVISGGRFVVNLVNGWWEEEFNIFSNGGWLDRDEERYHRMDEFVQVLKGMWTQRVFSFHGNFYHADSARLPLKPLQRPSPPIYTTTHAELGQDFVAKHCEHWFVSYRPGHRRFQKNWETIALDITRMRENAHKYGRRLGFAISANVICAPAESEALAEADRMEEEGQTSGKPASSVIGLGAGLVGSPALIAERIQQYQEIGVECFMLRFPRLREGIEMFGRDILPRLETRIRTIVAA
jgi:FMNH2-dependent dimethyl sulfone monooxygenase